MPKVSGIFEIFDNLETIPGEDFVKWLKKTHDPILLKNFAANLVLYPQTIPVTQDEMQWELAILREVIKKTPTFMNIPERKILIPASFLQRINDLSKLAWVFIDAYLPDWIKNNPGQNVWTVVLRDEEKDEIVGSVIIPELTEKLSFIEIAIDGKGTKVPKGGLAVVPCSPNKCKIGFKVSKGVLLGINEGTVEVYGGRLGLVVDGR